MAGYSTLPDETLVSSFRALLMSFDHEGNCWPAWAGVNETTATACRGLSLEIAARWVPEGVRGGVDEVEWASFFAALPSSRQNPSSPRGLR